jgi:hypothetical protein
MVKIITALDFPAAISSIVTELDTRNPKPSLIRVEGFCGAGKTGLACEVSKRIGGVHIAGDNYANKLDPTPAYPQCIRREEWERDIGEAISTRPVVILDAVCLNDIAPVERWGRGFMVYVKRLSFNNQDSPMWSGGFHLENEPTIPDKAARAVLVRDLPTRLFHWLAVVLVVAAYLT